jgi:hypothetical protein
MMLAGAQDKVAVLIEGEEELWLRIVALRTAIDQPDGQSRR